MFRNRRQMVKRWYETGGMQEKVCGGGRGGVQKDIL